MPSSRIASIEEEDLLDYIGAKVEAGQRPATIQNALWIVRRVLNLAARDGFIARNPANGIGRLIARVTRREDSEVKVADAWTRGEAEGLLAVAEQLGHANPELTLRVYAHALPVEGSDMSLADFGAASFPRKRVGRVPDVSESLYPSPAIPDHGCAS